LTKKISFTKLGEEQCEVCEEYYYAHSKSCRSSNGEDSNSSCNVCKRWYEHINKTRDARKMYRHDAKKKWPDDTSVRSVDLQKVIILPQMPGMKTAAFTKRIIAFL